MKNTLVSSIFRELESLVVQNIAQKLLKYILQTAYENIQYTGL